MCYSHSRRSTTLRCYCSSVLAIVAWISVRYSRYVPRRAIQSIFLFNFSVKLDNCRASDNRSTRGSSERWAELCRRGTTSLHAEHVDDPIPESARGFLPRCSRTARSLCDTSAKDAVVPRSHKTANLYRRVPHTKRLAERHRAIVPSNTFRPRVRRSDVQCRKYSDEESARRCGGFRLHYLHI